MKILLKHLTYQVSNDWLKVNIVKQSCLQCTVSCHGVDICTSKSKILQSVSNWLLYLEV